MAVRQGLRPTAGGFSLGLVWLGEGLAPSSGGGYVHQSHAADSAEDDLIVLVPTAAVITGVFTERGRGSSSHRNFLDRPTQSCEVCKPISVRGEKGPKATLCSCNRPYFHLIQVAHHDS